MLVRNVGLKGRQKLGDIWDKYPYIVKSQPFNDIPVYEVQRENSPSLTRLLHRNMLLPFSGLPYINDEEDEEQIDSVVETPVDDRYTDDSSDSSTDSDSETENITQKNQPAQKYIIPQRRGQGDRKNERDTRNQEHHKAMPRRGHRHRQPPTWMRTGDWQIQLQPFIISVDPSDIVMI